MTITEISPPQKKTFRIDLDEDDMKILGAIMGDMGMGDIRERIHESFHFKDATVPHGWNHQFYRSICLALGR